jgi:hypothetical protein
MNRSAASGDHRDHRDDPEEIIFEASKGYGVQAGEAKKVDVGRNVLPKSRVHGFVWAWIRPR